MTGVGYIVRAEPSGAASSVAVTAPNGVTAYAQVPNDVLARGDVRSLDLYVDHARGELYERGVRTPNRLLTYEILPGLETGPGWPVEGDHIGPPLIGPRPPVGPHAYAWADLSSVPELVHEVCRTVPITTYSADDPPVLAWVDPRTRDEVRIGPRFRYDGPARTPWGAWCPLCGTRARALAYLDPPRPPPFHWGLLTFYPPPEEIRAVLHLPCGHYASNCLAASLDHYPPREGT